MWGRSPSVTLATVSHRSPSGMDSRSHASPFPGERQPILVLSRHVCTSLRRFYFDWARARASLVRGQHPVTPPVSLFYALDLALEMLLAEGLEAIFTRHRHLGEYVRKHVRAIGLHLLADPVSASNTVTAVRVPEGIDAKALLNTLRERDRVVRP